MWFQVQFGANGHMENFSKTTKPHEPVEQVQFVVWNQIAREIML